MFPLEDVIQIIQNGKMGSDQSQLMKIRDLDQILENQYNIGQYILLFLAIDNRKNPVSKYCNLSIQQICDLFNVPRATYYHKRKLYETDGIWGLVSKKPGPKFGSRIDPDIKQRIVELREKELPCKTINTMLTGQSLGKISVPTITIYRYLKSIGKNRLARNKRAQKQQYKRFERSTPNDLWQIDNVGPFYKPGKLFAYDIIDDHSRYSLGFMIADNQKTRSWVKYFEELFKKYGTPDAILHDHGSQFVALSTNLLTNDIKKLFDMYKIRSVRARVRHPQTTGKVERFQRSLMHEAREIVHTQSLSDFQEVVDAWRDYYNIARVHASTGVSPYERYYGHAPDAALIKQACDKYEEILIKYPL
jgi:transposase InsO family protein